MTSAIVFALLVVLMFALVFYTNAEHMPAAKSVHSKSVDASRNRMLDGRGMSVNDYLLEAQMVGETQLPQRHDVNN